MGLAEVLARIDRENAVNCTGIGEVGCKGREGWHSWSAHRAHVAEAQVAAVTAHLAEVLGADATREAVAESLLTEHMDGDYLVAAGRSIGNEGGDVGLNEARPSEVAWWATNAALAAVRTALGIGAAT